MPPILVYNLILVRKTERTRIAQIQKECNQDEVDSRIGLIVVPFKDWLTASTLNPKIQEKIKEVTCWVTGGKENVPQFFAFPETFVVRLKLKKWDETAVIKVL